MFTLRNVMTVSNLLYYRGVHESLHVVGLASRKSKSGGSSANADMSETSANCSQSGFHSRCKVDGA